MQQDDRIFAAVAACVVVAVALAAAVMWLASGISVEAPRAATVNVSRLEAPTLATSTRPEPEVVATNSTSDGDDSMVRAAVARLSSHPTFAAYLVNDRLLSRFVAVVDSIAGGYNPGDEVEFMRPTADFVVREDEGRLVIAAGSFRRYTGIADTFASLDIDGAVALYRRFSPRLDEIYGEIGWDDEGFDARFRRAVDHLLAVDVPVGPIEVEQRAIVYAFAEDEFEELTDAQKLLVRMGTANARRVQRTLTEFRAAVGWPELEEVLLTAELDEMPAPSATDAPMAGDGSPSLSTDPITERTGAPEAH